MNALQPLPEAVLGMVGLGVMGRNLALNLSDHGLSVAGYDRDPEKAKAFPGGVTSPAALVDRLKKPRTILLLVPAGEAVDDSLAELIPYLSPGDLVIDGGNSFFKDTENRARALTARGILYLGMGISGGEQGARTGPSLMPGGPREAFEKAESWLNAVAARANGEPCVAYLGQGASGHFVKMVHNGIEYAVMQLIAETYDLMRRGLGLGPDVLHDIYTEWNRLALSSYLLEITASIFTKADPKTGRKLVEVISDVARQKGTGKWASQTALELGVPLPTIDAAVMMRELSTLSDEREEASRVLAGPIRAIPPGAQDGREDFLEKLRAAYHYATVVAFAQGMALITKASDVYRYHISNEAVARVWRGGCILRATLLDGIAAAYRERPDLPNLLLDPGFAKLARSGHGSLRSVCVKAASWGVPAPAFMSALSYYDAYRSSRLPTNLIQAQRDFFGAHTYERIDEKGTFHTEWQS